MNPVLRLRRAMGADEEQAEEAAGAIDDEYVGRELFEARQNQQTAVLSQQMAELRKEMAELRNQILIGALLIAALAVAVLTIVIAVFD